MCVDQLSFECSGEGLSTWAVSVDSTVAGPRQPARRRRTLYLAGEPGREPLALVVTAAPRSDSPQFHVVLDGIRVARCGRGRTRSDRVRADKACGSRGNRAYLRQWGIQCAIPKKADQMRNRITRACVADRPPTVDPAIHRQRHAVECGIDRIERHCVVSVLRPSCASTSGGPGSPRGGSRHRPARRPG
ncbi:transposase [Nocardia sp. R7R-8]|uniref:transposase n=1 Tax=Nocardia sp. R7R-8 TaxID=3459304 RepID=UPI00403D693E